MMVILVPKGQIGKGFTCQVCRAAVPATALYRTHCPKCRQLYITQVTQ